MIDREQIKREKLYAETRRDLLSRQLSNSEKFDGAVLTLSTGALGLSLTFLRDMVSIEKVQQLSLLIWSWRFFGGAIILTILSFMFSQWGINKQLQYAEEYYLNRKDEYLKKVNPCAKVTNCLNICSGISFILAIIFTVCFVSANVKNLR